jgi:hypothetical protein
MTMSAIPRSEQLREELRASLVRLTELIEEMLTANAEHAETEVYVTHLLGRIECRLGGDAVAPEEVAELEVVGRPRTPRRRHQAAYGDRIYAVLTETLKTMGPTSASDLAAQLNRLGQRSPEGGALNGRNIRFLLGSGRIPVVIEHDRRGERRYQLDEASSVAPVASRMLSA